MQNTVIPNEKLYSRMTIVIYTFFGIFWLVTMLGIVSIDLSIFFLLLSIITGIFFFKEKYDWKKYLLKDKNGKCIRPWWLSWTAEMFYIVLFLFLFRGFIAEPFKIPTGSMIPTINIGNIVFINKFFYDVKIPVIENSIYKNHNVSRGEIVVFRFPKDPSVYYIKRFVGLPGDTLMFNFKDKNLYINNKKITRELIKQTDPDTKGSQVQIYNENLLGVQHKIMIDNSVDGLAAPDKIDFNSNCKYTLNDMTCVIPKEYYFAMGDNRDNSLDSRYWGFVPHQNIIGKAILNLGNYKNYGLLD